MGRGRNRYPVREKRRGGRNNECRKRKPNHSSQVRDRSALNYETFNLNNRQQEKKLTAAGRQAENKKQRARRK